MDASLQSRAEQLAGEIASQARTAEDLNGLMRLMMKSALERMLNTEMDVHCLSMGGNEALAFRRSLQVHYCGWKTIELLHILVLISSTTLYGRQSTVKRC